MLTCKCVISKKNEAGFTIYEFLNMCHVPKKKARLRDTVPLTNKHRQI